MRQRAIAMPIALALTAGCVALSSCGVISAVKKAVDTAEANKAIMDAFTKKIKSGEATTFEATYITTGSAPATVVYAVKPPNGVLFTDTQTPVKGGNDNGNNNNAYFVVNPTGEYGCSRSDTSTGSAQWNCDKLPKASAADYNNILSFYTPSHWVSFLNGFAIAAGIAGDKVTNSTMKVNGFALSCVDFVAPGVKGTSKICTTSQNILGYVNVAGDSTQFEIKNYSGSPAASLFELPAGAKITNVTVPSSSVPSTT